MDASEIDPRILATEIGEAFGPGAAHDPTVKPVSYRTLVARVQRATLARKATRRHAISRRPARKATARRTSRVRRSPGTRRVRVTDRDDGGSSEGPEGPPLAGDHTRLEPGTGGAA